MHQLQLKKIKQEMILRLKILSQVLKRMRVKLSFKAILLGQI